MAHGYAGAGRSLRTAGLVALSAAAGAAGYQHFGLDGAVWALGAFGAASFFIGLWVALW